MDFDRRNDVGRGEQVVRQGHRQGLPGIVVAHPFVERRADAMHDAAMDLALDQHRIDHAAAIVDDEVAPEPHLSGLAVDLGLDHMGPVGIGHGGRLVVARRR